MFGWLMLFLFFIMCLTYIVYNWCKDEKFCGFLEEIPFIGDFLFKHDFIFFVAAFWTTALTLVGTIWAFIQFYISIIILLEA